MAVMKWMIATAIAGILSLLVGVASLVSQEFFPGLKALSHTPAAPRSQGNRT